MWWIFWCPVLGNQIRFFSVKICLKQLGKKIRYLMKFRPIFKIFSECMYFCFFVGVRSTDNVDWILLSPKYQKIWILVFWLLLIYLFIYFKSTLNWLSFTAKITAVSWLIVEYLRIINVISLNIPKNSRILEKQWNSSTSYRTMKA